MPSRHKHYGRLLWSVSWQALISSVRIMLLLSLSPSPYLSFVSFSLLFPSPYLSFASCSIPFPCPYLSIASFSILSAVPTLSFLVVPAFQSKLQLLCFPPFLNLPTDLSTGIHCVVEPVCSSALHGATKARRTTVEVGIRVALTLTLPRSHTVHLLAHCSKALLNTNWLSCIESER